MILVDSSYIIALINDRDKNHNRAKELFEDISKEKKLIPLLMLSEAVTTVNSRKGPELSKLLFDVLCDDFKVYYPNQEEISKSMDCVIKYKSLSLADCFAVYLMRKLNITRIYSFDSDFDKVDGIVRVF